MCSSTQPKMFPGSMPLGSGGTFSMPITYQSGQQPAFDAGNPANFPKITPPATPPGLPVATNLGRRSGGSGTVYSPSAGMPFGSGGTPDASGWGYRDRSAQRK